VSNHIERVYLLVEKLEPVGGVAEQVTLLATELKRRDVDVWVFARRLLGRDNQYALRLRGAGVHLFTCPARLYALDPRPTWAARSVLIRVLSWFTYPLLAPISLLDAVRRRRTLSASWAGAVGRVRGRLAAHILRDGLEDAFAALLNRHAAEAPPDVVDVSGVDCLQGVAWAHRRGYPVVFRQTSLPNVEEPLTTRQIADLHRATCLMAVSRAVASRMRPLLRDDRPIWVVPNAVPDPGHEGDRSNGFHGHGRDGALVVCLSRLSSEKGVQYIPEVARRVLHVAPRTQFVVAGDGPLRRHLEERCIALGLGDAVRFLGDLPHDRALDLLRRADIMFLPSRREGMPVAAIEAMALARAMVVTSVGGTPELVQDGVSALLIPPDHVGTMVQAILRLIADAALRQRLGHHARLAYERGPYRPHAMAELTLAVYRQSLEAVAATATSSVAAIAVSDATQPAEGRRT
jgi:glycosyltransferase involved in cell wall biosynthesis